MSEKRSDKEIAVFEIQRFEDLAQQNGVRF